MLPGITACAHNCLPSAEPIAKLLSIFILLLNSFQMEPCASNSEKRVICRLLGYYNAIPDKLLVLDFMLEDIKMSCLLTLCPALQNI